MRLHLSRQRRGGGRTPAHQLRNLLQSTCLQCSAPRWLADRAFSVTAARAQNALPTGVSPAGDTSPNILAGGDVNGNIPTQYYYVVSDIADQYWLPYVRSASSRFHSAIRRHQFASVRQADSRLTRLVPNLGLALTPPALASSVRSAPSLLQFRRDLKTALHLSVIVLFTIVFGCV